MAKPPIYPMKVESGQGVTYFQVLCGMVKKYLEEDGISLDFGGYTDTIIDYTSLTENDMENAWKLTKELNAWSEYFSDIANLIQKIYLDSETDKIEKQAVSSITNDASKVANGDRISNKDPIVVSSRKKRNILKSFYDELVSKVDFLNRAHYHCKSTYEWSKKLSMSNLSNTN